MLATMAVLVSGDRDDWHVSVESPAWLGKKLAERRANEDSIKNKIY